METQQMKNNHYSEDVNLMELLYVFWQQKWLILGFVFFSLTAGLVYLWQAKPLYEAKIYTLPPALFNISEINKGRLDEKKAALKTFKTKDVYAIFIRALSAESTKTKFYKSVYLPEAKVASKHNSAELSFHQFENQLTIKKLPQPDQNTPSSYMVAIKGSQPEYVEKFLRKYVNFVKEKALNELVNTANRQTKKLVNDIDHKIGLARRIAHDARSDRLTQLKEALAIANEIGIKEYPVNSGSIVIASSEQPNLLVEENILYHRGSKALEAEINQLSKRTSDDPFIPGLRKLQNKLEFYSNLKVNPQLIQMFRLDGEDLPAVRISPRKKLVLILSLAVGLMLGVLFALIRNFFLHRNQYRSS